MPEFTLSEAVAEAAKWGNTIRAFAKVQEVLTAAQSLEQNRSERQSLVDKLGAEVATLREQSDAAQRSLQEAQEQSARVLKAAATEAAEIVKGAKAEALRINDESAASAAAAAVDLQALQLKAAEATTQVQAAANELAETLRRIEDAKAAARALLG